MPLTKSFTTGSGHAAEYHVLEEKTLDMKNQTGSMVWRAYKDAAAYGASNDNVGEFTIPIGAEGKQEDGTDVWTKFPWSELGNEETYLKGGKFRYGSTIVDMAAAVVS